MRSFKSYIALDMSILKLKESSDQDSAEEKKCRNSQISGLKRKESLDEFCKDNDYIQPFYAKHTFEVDFVNNTNEHVIKGILDTLFSFDSATNESIEKIDTDVFQ